MIYVALAFLAAFVSFFVYWIVHAIRRGVLSNRGSTFTRSEQPILFWMNLGGYIVCAAVGAIFFFGVVGILLDPAQ